VLCLLRPMKQLVVERSIRSRGASGVYARYFMDIGEESFANRESRIASGEEGSHVDVSVMPEARGERKKRRRILRAAKAARGVVCPFTLPLLASLDSRSSCACAPRARAARTA